MKRVGKRGEGRFERISWDEALDRLAGQMQRVRETYGNQRAVRAIRHGQL